MIKLTENEKRLMDKMPTIGYWPGLGGVELKKVEPGNDDYCLCIVKSWKNEPTYHRVRVYSTNTVHKEPREFIILYYERFYLDECILSLQ